MKKIGEPQEEKEFAAAAEDTRKCPFCKEDIKSDATFCKHCHQWLDCRPQNVVSFQHRTLKVVLMILCSFGIYYFWWAYKNWAQLRTMDSRISIPEGGCWDFAFLSHRITSLAQFCRHQRSCLGRGRPGKNREGMAGRGFQALGAIEDTRAIEPLIQVLKDNNGSVRANAAVALGMINDTRAVETIDTASQGQR